VKSVLRSFFANRSPAPLTTRLTTARLVLRPPLKSDTGALQHFLQRNAAHLRPWSPAPAPGQDPTTVTHLRDLIAQQRDAWVEDRGYAFLIETPEGELIGRINLNQVVRGVFQNAYLGYLIGEQSQGRGLMTEAVRLVVDFAFSTLNLHRVQAAVMPHNGASRRVLAKADFREEGVARSYLQIAGRWEDHVLHAITREEWRPLSGPGAARARTPRRSTLSCRHEHRGAGPRAAGRGKKKAIRGAGSERLDPPDRCALPGDTSDRLASGDALGHRRRGARGGADRPLGAGTRGPGDRAGLLAGAVDQQGL
jgi:ribosomal-protein-alanine N-acetyltransferase